MRVPALIVMLGACAAMRLAAAQAPDVAVAAFPEVVTARPGAAFRVVVRASIPEGWHIGWTNPGPRGSASTLEWRRPRGVRDVTTAWPTPQLDTGSGASANVLKGDVLIFSTFRVAPDAAPGVIELRGTLSVGLCQASCEPRVEHFSLTLGLDTVPSEPAPAWLALEAAGAPARPAPLDHRFVRAAFDRDSIRLTIQLPGGPPSGSSLTFFPAGRGRAAVVTRAHTTRDFTFVRLPLDARDGVGRIAGVLSSDRPWGLQGPGALAVDTHVYGAAGVR